MKLKTPELRCVIFVLLCLGFVQSLFAVRSIPWRPERLPGSSRLSIDSIRWLVLPPKADEDLLRAANDLAEVFKLRGIDTEIVEADGLKPRYAIIISPYGRSSRDLGGGYLIRRRQSRVYIRSADTEGLVNGIYAICQELLGARWYWPSELGFQLTDVYENKFPDRLWWGRPAFIERRLHPVDTDFGRRNGLNRLYSFNHNLARIFNEDVYRKHPEAFAEIGGKRSRPKGSRQIDRQPDFTEAVTVDLSVAAVRTHFAEEPDSMSFSLSINDNVLFDQSAETEAVVSPIDHFRGLPNYTNLVFGYMNKVASNLFSDSENLKNDSGHNRYLTALAYYWTEQSPSFEIHPRIMPVLTSDRGQWHDPKYREEDKALIRRWVNSGAERIATWDYYFGAPYPYPRQFNQWIGESIKFLHREGVDVFFSQLPSVWGLDGPKAWLTAQLLWNPKQDVEELLDEFYTNFFGAAAEPMREFYEIAEDIRNENEGEAAWIKFYKDEAGIELFDRETLKKMRDQISLAQILVRNDQSRLARVLVVSLAFEFTEAYATFHYSRRELFELSLSSLNNKSTQSNPSLLEVWDSYLKASSNFDILKKRINEEPMCKGLRRFDSFLQSAPEPLAMAAFSKLQLDSSSQLESEAVDPSRFEMIQAASLAWGENGPVFESVIDNSSLRHTGQELRDFLGPKIPRIDGWRIQYRPSQGFLMRSAAESFGSGLRIENANIVALTRICPVAPGRPHVLDMLASWKVSPDNRTWIQLVWRAEDGKTLKTQVPMMIPTGSSNEPQVLSLLFDPPRDAIEVGILVMTNRQSRGDFIELEKLDFGPLRPAD
ncbi:MAG: DUF4838 domain-containing protein [Verrucomicrobiota bacterium]